jgi:hypothetical protein
MQRERLGPLAKAGTTPVHGARPQPGSRARCATGAGPSTSSVSDFVS